MEAGDVLSLTSLHEDLETRLAHLRVGEVLEELHGRWRFVTLVGCDALGTDQVLGVLS